MLFYKKTKKKHYDLHYPTLPHDVHADHPLVLMSSRYITGCFKTNESYASKY